MNIALGVLNAFRAAIPLVFKGGFMAHLMFGSVTGLIFGAMPGLGGVAALALLLPISWGMNSQSAFAMFGGCIGAVPCGGAITAILLNTPGTAANIATTFDGYPLTLKGKAGVALGASAMASQLGGIFGILILIILLPVAAAIVMSFGPPEFFLLGVVGLVALAVFIRGSIIRSLFAGVFGLLISFIGYDPVTGVIRYSMGTQFLYDGVKLLPLLLGLYAVTEAFNLLMRGGKVVQAKTESKFSDVVEGMKAVFRYKWTFLRSSALGTIIGMIPGMGGVVANTFAWITAASLSPNRERFGTGEVEGVVACESANNSKDGGAILPTIAFGIPGSAEMAVLLGAFVLHGLVPGPRLLTEQLPMVWVLIISVTVGNIVSAVFTIFSAKYLVLVGTLKSVIIAPLIVSLSVIGCVVVTNDIGDGIVAILFGVIGFFMVRFGFSRISLALGFILGAMMETAFHQTLLISDVGPFIFFQRITSVILIILIIAALLFGVGMPFLRNMKKKTKGTGT